LLSPSESAGQRDYLLQLAMIREDPRIRRLALSRARDPEHAADALQETFCAMARQDYRKIDDLRKYFTRVLINEIYRLRRPGPVSVGYIEEAVGASQWNAGGHSPPEAFDEAVCDRLLAQTRLRAFRAQRGSLAHRIPGRSPDPRRYRAAILDCAEAMLAAAATDDLGDTDPDSVLHSEYPAWFAEEGCTKANIYQRFKRARDDLRAVLRPIVSPEDLC